MTGGPHLSAARRAGPGRQRRKREGERHAAAGLARLGPSGPARERRGEKGTGPKEGGRPRLISFSFLFSFPIF
jgi:hypothetical protein